jgi:Histidine kinase
MKRQLPIWVIAVCALIWVCILGVDIGEPPQPWGGLAALIGFGGMIALWIRGLRPAEYGWKRHFHLVTFAFTLAECITNARDFSEGFARGWHDYTQTQLPGYTKPMVVESVQAQWDWINLTLVTLALFILLDQISKRINRQEAQEEAMATLSRKAQELSLRAKLAPHFIFNTLNTLKAQIKQDPGAAAATTDKLAMLFRQILEVSDAERIPLRQELLFVEAYLSIEQARLGERLQVRIEVPEELESIEIPPLSLQVLVENAVKHGVAPSERGGLVQILASRSADSLKLEVRDPGTGISKHQGTGTALDTLRQRLAKPEDLRIKATPEGVRATLRWRIA